MIKNSQSLSIAEAQTYVKNSEESNSEIKEFINKFVTLKEKEAKELRGNLEKLDLLKLRANHISKIIDLLPENKEELNKICVDANLNEDETNNIINTIKEFK